MISTGSLRNCQRYSEILNGLVRLSIREGAGFLWQRQGKGRKLWPVKVSNLDVNSKVLKVALDCDLHIPIENSEICLNFDEIDPRSDLYFKGDEKEILFKSERGAFSICDELINIPIPDVAFFREYRSHPRHEPAEPMTLLFKTVADSKDNLQVIMSCNNIGRGGIGARLGVGHAHLFHKGDTLFLERIGDITLKKPYKVEIVYKRQVRNKEEVTILMGLKFDQELPSDIFKKIIG